MLTTNNTCWYTWPFPLLHILLLYVYITFCTWDSLLWCSLVINCSLVHCSPDVCTTSICCYSMFFYHIGAYHQYDGMILPEGSKYFILFGTPSSATKMPIPAYDLVHQKCLPVYLEHQKDVLLKCNVEDIWSLAENVLQVFHHLLNLKVYYTNRPHLRKVDGVSEVCTYVCACV